MKIGCVSHYAEFWSALWRAEQAGHEVMLHADEPGTDIGNGFIRKAKSAEEVVKWADFTVVDGCGFGEQAEKWRKDGHHIVNGSVWSDQLEEDRAFGMSVAKEIGMAVPTCKEFGTIKEAIQYIEANPAPYAVKMSGADSSATSVVATEDDSGDVLAALDGFVRNPKSSKGVNAVAVQKRVKGLEIGCAAFANGHGFSMPWNVYFEQKPLLAGDVGPLTGEQCDVSFNRDDRSARLWKETLGLLDPIVKQNHYVGEIGIGTIYDGERFQFLEFTARVGYPSSFIEGELIDGTYAEFFAALLGDAKLPWRREEWACGVNVSAMGYPWEESYKAHGKGTVVRMDYGRGLWPLDVMLEPDETVLTAGVLGLVACCVGTGKMLPEAITRSYDVVKRLILPHKMYRIDAGAKVLKSRSILEELL